MKELHYESCCFTKAERNTASIPARDFFGLVQNLFQRTTDILSIAYPQLGF